MEHMMGTQLVVLTLETKLLTTRRVAVVTR